MHVGSYPHLLCACTDGRHLCTQIVAPHAPDLTLDEMAAEARRLLAASANATTLPWAVDTAPGLCGHDPDRYHVIAAPEAAIDAVALVPRVDAVALVPRVEGAEADAEYLALAVNAAPGLARAVIALAARLTAAEASAAAAVARADAAVAAHAALAAAVKKVADAMGKQALRSRERGLSATQGAFAVHSAKAGAYDHAENLLREALAAAGVTR